MSSTSTASTKPTLIVYPLGCADTALLTLEGGERILFDYAAMRDPDESDQQDDRRIDLPTSLRETLGEATEIEVVVFTHSDHDHVNGASDFFELTHAKKYQGGDRITIGELWVPAAFICKTDYDSEDARVLHQEACHRLREGVGIRVFGRPAALAEWLADHSLTLDDRRDCLVDAGTLVPRFTLDEHGVEFFVHSPFAIHQDDDVVDTNQNCIVLQATFDVEGQTTRLLVAADIPWDALQEIVKITQAHNNDDRLLWDIVKLPHHCSYLSLSDEKGDEQTDPKSEIAWLYEDQGQNRAILVASCDPIPEDDASDQPPHRQAAAYYQEVAEALDGTFVVTMEHPSERKPEPLVIEIGRAGAELKRMRMTSTVAITSRPAPRAG